MDGPALPEITTEAVEAVFNTLSIMEVELDPDPLQFGPKRLNGKVAEARGMLTDCESLFLKVSLWLQKYRAAHRTLETEMDLAKKHLYANDPEVRAGRNVADRDALATMKLRDQARALATVAQSQADLEAMLTVIKAKRTDLKDVQGRIRDQIKLCQEEIALGGQWGSKPKPGAKAPNLDESPNVDKKTLRDLHHMFTGLREKNDEPDLASVVTPLTEASEPDVIDPETPVDSDPPEPIVDSSGTDEEADEYLSLIEPPKVEDDHSDLDDILDGLDL